MSDNENDTISVQNIPILVSSVIVFHVAQTYGVGWITTPVLPDPRCSR